MGPPGIADSKGSAVTILVKPTIVRKGDGHVLIAINEKQGRLTMLALSIDGHVIPRVVSTASRRWPFDARPDRVEALVRRNL